MRGSSPAAELAAPVFVRRRNPFRDRKLSLRVPSATLPPGDDGHSEALVRREHNAVFSEADVDLRSPRYVESRRAFVVRLSRVFGRCRGEPTLWESRKGAKGCGQEHRDCAIDAGAVPFPARSLSPQSNDAGRPPARRRGLALDPRPRRRGTDPVDAGVARLRADAGAEEAPRLSRGGENGRGRQRHVTACAVLCELLNVNWRGARRQSSG